jgi:acyl-CoA dehydrogenase
MSPTAIQTLSKASEFLTNHLLPVEKEIIDHMENSPAKWTQVHPKLEEVKAEARKAGLWNLFMPVETDKGKYGAGFTNVEYAPVAELTGRVSFLAPEVLNCSAPDTGNMEVLARYGTEAQKQKWLMPLLQGSIRSCFAMVTTLQACICLTS